MWKPKFISNDKDTKEKAMNSKEKGAKDKGSDSKEKETKDEIVPQKTI